MSVRSEPGTGSALSTLRSSPGAAAGPVRKRFDQLLRDLDRLRGELRGWEQALPQWQQDYQARLGPLFVQRDRMDIRLLECLDQASLTERLAKADRVFLSELVCALAGPLIEAGHVELKPIYDRHSLQGFDADVAESDARMRQAIAAAFGLAPDEVEGSPEDVFEQVRAREQAQAEHARQRQAQRRKREAARRQTVADEPPPLRILYRRLAAELHPDRARDAGDGQRRTALMQRLNAAYQAEDLAGLIELQVEIGQLDGDRVQAMGEDRLRQYNRDLARQCKQLRERIRGQLDDFCGRYDIDLPGRAKPAQLPRVLAQMTRALGQELSERERELHALQDPVFFKHWLRQQRRASAEMEAALAAFDPGDWP